MFSRSWMLYMKPTLQLELQDLATIRCLVGLAVACLQSMSSLSAGTSPAPWSLRVTAASILSSFASRKVGIGLLETVRSLILSLSWVQRRWQAVTQRQAQIQATVTLTWMQWDLLSIGLSHWGASTHPFLLTPMIMARWLLWRNFTKCTGASSLNAALATSWSE